MKLKAMLLAVSVVMVGAIGGGVAYAGDDWIEYKTYQDPNFDSVLKTAEQTLIQKGYTIADIDVEGHFGKPVLEVEAYKDYQEYDIVMSYPDLKIISEHRDY